MDEIKLGDFVRDTVTGFKGIVVCRAEYLNGCTRLAVQPVVDKQGAIPAQEYLDLPQVQLVKRAPTVPVPRATGGPQRSDPPSRYRR